MIENCLRTAGSAPNGANLQPWHFVAVSDPALKHEIRVAAEAEEREFYEHRAPANGWRRCAALGTDASQAVSRNRALADRDFFAAVSSCCWTGRG